MKALSVRQPYAAAILAGSKRLEFRTWATAYRGPLLIHAAGRKATALACADFPALDPALFVYGAVAGIVHLLDCQSGAADAYGAVEYHWHLAEARPFAVPVVLRGRLGLFEVEDALVAAALALSVTVPSPGS